MLGFAESSNMKSLSSIVGFQKFLLRFHVGFGLGLGMIHGAGRQS